MADNDEYEFTDLEAADAAYVNEEGEGEGENSTTTQVSPPSEKKDIRRNSLIVVGLVIFALIMYQLLGFFFAKKPEVAKNDNSSLTPSTIVPTAPANPETSTEISAVPIQSNVAILAEKPNELQQKMSALEISGQSMRSEVSSISTDLSNLNNNVNNINTEITKLNQLITDLSNQVAKQSDALESLTTRLQAKKRSIQSSRHNAKEAVNYHIQAVIPGRAWLIGSNGSILTIREGTTVQGYGIVKLIDSMQGRILTSSGRVIRFSQDDS